MSEGNSNSNENDASNNQPPNRHVYETRSRTRMQHMLLLVEEVIEEDDPTDPSYIPPANDSDESESFTSVSEPEIEEPEYSNGSLHPTEEENNSNTASLDEPKSSHSTGNKEEENNENSQKKYGENELTSSCSTLSLEH